MCDDEFETNADKYCAKIMTMQSCNFVSESKSLVILTPYCAK